MNDPHVVSLEYQFVSDSTLATTTARAGPRYAVPSGGRPANVSSIIALRASVPLNR